MEDIVDNTFAMTDYLEELVMGFQVNQIISTLIFRWKVTQVSVWSPSIQPDSAPTLAFGTYQRGATEAPYGAINLNSPRLRGKTEDDAWWKEIGAIAPKVKEQMILEVKENWNWFSS